MKADVFYTTALGRMLLKALQQVGIFKLVAWFLHTRLSRCFVPFYIKNNHIDMTPYKGQHYHSFADFFARKQGRVPYDTTPEVLISPCDASLSLYPVTADLTIAMKGSHYTVSDLLPNREKAALFREGLCLIFRLEASDYHHFCCFDDGSLVERHFIEGQLHSVQPIAHRHVPVFRLNRRWWSILESKHFGTAAQIEVGAMAVGGVTFAINEAPFKRGDEMGNFELAGSTIVLLLPAATRNALALYKPFAQAMATKAEVPVRMGMPLGYLQEER